MVDCLEQKKVVSLGIYDLSAADLAYTCFSGFIRPLSSLIKKVDDKA